MRFTALLHLYVDGSVDALRACPGGVLPALEMTFRPGIYLEQTFHFKPKVLCTRLHFPHVAWQCEADPPAAKHRHGHG